MKMENEFETDFDQNFSHLIKDICHLDNDTCFNFYGVDKETLVKEISSHLIAIKTNSLKVINSKKDLG
jgi:hypothetical protein